MRKTAGGCKLLPFLCLLFGHFGWAQNTIGIPVIVNYPKQVYNAGSQNWDIAQAPNGIIYFANNDGLLTFDGNYWRKYFLPNKTKVRSVAIDKDNRIYIGGQNEIGYFSTRQNGALAYTSLMPLVQGSGKDFTDVWNICLYKDHVFFRAYRKVLEYDGKNIRVHDGVLWNFLGSTRAGLLALDFEKKLITYKDGRWLPAAKNNALAADAVLRATIDMGPDSVLLATQQHGLFLLHRDSITAFRSPDLASIAASNIYGAVLLDQDRIALNTNLSGCIIINKKGEFVQRISKREGIQNNNVLSMLFDRDKNLWFGTDNGIDLVLYSNAIQQIFPDGEDRNAGYASMLYGNKLYLGLVSGAYMVPVTNRNDLSYTRGDFRFIKGSKGQVWNFSTVNNKLLMGHLRGAFEVEGEVASALATKTGFWGFQPVTVSGSPYEVVAGTYNGIHFYRDAGGKLMDSKVDARFESARFIVQHQNAIWASHPFKGLYRISFRNGTPVVTTFTDRRKVLSTNHNKIFSIGGKMVLISDKGIFEYDDQTAGFLPSTDLAKLSTVGTISYLKEDPSGNVWFTTDKKIGVMDRSAGSPRIVFIPELTNKIQANGFEDINIIDSSNILVTGEAGFYHLNYAAYKKNKYALHAFVSNVSIIAAKDSLLFGGYAPLRSAPGISYVNNSLHFEVATTLFGEESTIEYRYYLQGFDKDWSEWSRKTEKDYTNLPPGNYTFYVKCRNNSDNESEARGFAFTVLPPWYRTWWAYTFYAALIAGFLYLFYKYQQQKYKRQQQKKLLEQQRKYNEEQKRLQMLHQLEIAESEKQIAQLRSENLEAEVEHKNSELASSAMNLVRKMEILTRLKGDLLEFKDELSLHDAAKEKHFLKIIRVLDKELDSAEEWEQFAGHFDSVHTNFLKNLKAYCPSLTTADLKTAAYLRLNLSSKEIAQLMNISVRGVETSRYRLRKKLGLTNEVSLFDFLIEVTRQKEVQKVNS